MTIPTLTEWLLMAATVSGWTFALIAARRTSARSLWKRHSELLTRLTELEGDVDTLAATIKRAASRDRMRELRQHQNRTEPAAPAASENGSGRLPGESEAAYNDRWAREMNVKIATGQVKVR